MFKIFQSIRGKLILGYFSIAFFLLAVVVSIYFSAESSKGAVKEMFSSNTDAARGLIELKAHITRTKEETIKWRYISGDETFKVSLKNFHNFYPAYRDSLVSSAKTWEPAKIESLNFILAKTDTLVKAQASLMAKLGSFMDYDEMNMMMIGFP